MIDEQFLNLTQQKISGQSGNSQAKQSEHPQTEGFCTFSSFPNLSVNVNMVVNLPLQSRFISSWYSVFCSAPRQYPQVFPLLNPVIDK